MFNLIPWKRRSPEARSGDVVEREAHPLTRFRDEFENLMERFWSEIPSWPGGLGGHWGSEWSDEESQYVLRAEAPGFEPTDFDVQVSANQVVIRAERISAELKNGVLTVHLPKTEAVKPRRIQVKAA